MTQRSLERRYDAQRDGSIIQLLLCVTYSHIQHLEHLHAALLVRASHLFNEFGDLPTNPMVVRHLPLLPHIATTLRRPVGAPVVPHRTENKNTAHLKENTRVGNFTL